MGGLSVAAREIGMRVVVARAIAKIQPDCAVIENVSTVLAEKHGDRLENFRQVLAQAGYHVEKKVLDSSEYGVPQKRMARGTPNERRLS
jgi:site-specific DNA-cytosine methylase